MAMDEFVLQRVLEEIKKLVLKASGKNLAKDLAKDLDIISRLQGLFREVGKASPSEGSSYIEDMLRHLIIGTGYMFLTAQSAILSGEATKMEQPEVPKTKLFSSIIQKAEDHLRDVYRAKKKVTNLYEVIRAKVDEAPQVDYKLSAEYLLSLELKKEELNGELNTWKGYLEDTEGVLAEFDKEIKDYMTRESFKTKWMVGLFVVGTTVFTGGIGAIASGAGAIAAMGIGAVPLIGGGAAGGFVASLTGGEIYRYRKEASYDELRLQSANFKKRLKELRNDFTAAQNRSEALDKSLITIREKFAKSH